MISALRADCSRPRNKTINNIRGLRMKKYLTVLLSVLALGFAFSAQAGEHGDAYVESWQCELKDGKSVADVQAINSKWLAWVNERADGVVRSAVGTAVVGNSEIFMFIDTYPSLATWAKVKELLDSEEGNELTAMFAETSECSGNRLWRMQPTK
jgi:hypothetical protein